ncbi:uncharacterized protein I303_106821 [Kwoniella dejecticola CBS 10117]|uniref:Uncharacterized protein n=1 Tax=Kwoniella dejecticola CBS 10117 TaxID=1296121 RepID=A0A1A5ZTL8_9TREE|nr:uncharacterized protein I303_08536 [Kwoniella dejecticola CBS 10117]OBR81152.1 hypothetical protein I303_08536 [Kwoniella dejecticola CBS 10117]
MASTSSPTIFSFIPPSDLSSVGGYSPSPSGEHHHGPSQTALSLIITGCGVFGFWILVMIYWIWSLRRIARAKNADILSTEGRRETWVDSSNLPSPPISPMTHTFGFAPSHTGSSNNDTSTSSGASANITSFGEGGTARTLDGLDSKEKEKRLTMATRTPTYRHRQSQKQAQVSHIDFGTGTGFGTGTITGTGNNINNIDGFSMTSTKVASDHVHSHAHAHDQSYVDQPKGILKSMSDNQRQDVMQDTKVPNEEKEPESGMRRNIETRNKE